MKRKIETLTDEEKFNICKAYTDEYLSITEIKNIYNVSDDNIKKLLTEKGIEIDSRGKRGNRYIIDENIAKIELRRRNQPSLWATIDLQDLDKVINYDYTWHAAWRKKINGYYAVSSKYYITKDGVARSKPVYLHRYILDVNHYVDVDHINHDTLDDRRENMKIKNRTKNSTNRKGKNRNNVSGYRNVAYIKSHKSKPYHVQIMIDGKNTVVGKFSDPHEAGRFAEQMRYKYYGEDAGES